jgi:CBS domain-containing protein
MQRGVVSVSPELPVAELEAFLTSEEISGAPVIDTNGKLLGIVSQTDVIRALSEEPSVDLKELLTPDLTVENIMTSGVLTVTEHHEVPDVARAMLDAGVHRAVVMSGEDVVGIVTSFDLLRLLI